MNSYQFKTQSFRALRRTAAYLKVTLHLFGGVAFLWSSTVQANPVGEQVVAGAAGFERVGGALTIAQGTDRAVINWNSFSIGAGEITKFVQPNSSSAVLNRVITANNPSAIYGTLQANGQVYLINPAGIFIGPGGLVDTAGFVASTHDTGNKEFMAGGDLNFTGNSGASIVNQGRIEVKQGDVFLVAQQVSNEGQIMASDGTVGMISGTEVCLHSIGPNNYKVRLIDVANDAGVKKTDNGIADVVNAGVIEAANAELESTGNYLSLAIKNTGVIRATGVMPNADGTVTLTGGEGDVLNTGVVAAIQKNIQGETVGGRILASAKNIITDPGSIITAAGQEKGGEVKIDAKDTIYASGKIDATSSDGVGGKIVMTGERVGLVKAELDVSGALGGGEVLVGGDLSGSNPEVRNASALFMSPDSVISADATQNGNGGKVILWSDDYTGFYGNIFARGGPNGGDGGFVETSSLWNLQAMGGVDVGSYLGKGGEWLLDPAELYITTINSGVTTELNSTTIPYITSNGVVLPAGVFTGTTYTAQSDAQNAQVSVDRILFALNNNQNVIIRVGPASKVQFPGFGSVGSGSGNIYVSTDVIASTASTGSLSLINNWVFSGSSGYGSIFIDKPVTVGGSFTALAADDRGFPEVIDPTKTNGGLAGSITVASGANIYAGGVVTLLAGQSVASNTGGTGGDVTVNANIYGGLGLQVSAGNANRGWNTAAVYPGATPYLVQTTASGGTTGGAARASGGTAGTLLIANGVTFYLGNGNSTIQSGTAGVNQTGGNVTLSSTVLALGTSVNLTIAAGTGKDPGTLTMNSTLGVAGQTVNLAEIFAYDPQTPPPLTYTSQILNSLTLQAGNEIQVNAQTQATTINLQPYNPQDGMALGQTPISGLKVFYMSATTGLNNLLATSLNIGTPNSVSPAISAGSFVTGNDYFITSLGTTPLIQFTALGATAVAATALQVGTQYIITSAGNTTWTQVGALNNNVGTVFYATASGTGTGTTLATYFLAANSGAAITGTGQIKIATGDIGIGQVAPIVLSAQNVTFSGNASAVSFSSAAGQPYSLAVIPTTGASGSLTFDNGGALFSNYGKADVDVYVANNGSIRMQNVQMPGNNPVAAPGTGTLYLDVANLSADLILGNSNIQILKSSGSNNSGSIALGNITTLGATILGISQPGNFNLTALGSISQSSGTILTVRGTSSFTAGGAITLNNFNQFTGAVSLSTSSAGSVTIRDANALALGTLSVAGGLTANSTGALNLGQGTVATALTASSSGGAVTQTGALSIGGTSDINAGAALIDLATSSGGNNDFADAVSLANTGNNAISITDKNSLILGAVSQPGQAVFTVTVGAQASSGVIYTLKQTGAISTGSSVLQAGAFNVVAPSAASGGLLSMDLSTQDNIIRTPTITPQNPTQFLDFMIRNTAKAGVGGNSPINPDPDPGLAALPSTLRNLSVLYGITGTGLGTGTAPIVLPALPAVESTGNLQLLGTSVTQTAGGVLTVNTATIQATGGVITVDQSGNDFKGVVTLSNTGNNAISIRDKNSLILGNLSTAAGSAAVTIQVGTVAVGGTSLTQQTGTLINSLGTGNFTIVATGPTTSVNLATDSSGTSLANNIASANVELTGGLNFQDFSLRNTALTADTPTATTALSLRNLTLIFNNNLIQLPTSNFNNLTGNLVLTAGGNISQSGTLTVGGISTITSTGGNIDLSAALNNFTGAVNLSTSGNGTISVRDQNILDLGNVSMGATGSGTLTVRSGGTLTQFSGTTISSGTGAVEIIAGANDITLANQNDFRGTVTLTGGATSITDVNALTLGTLTTGALTAISTGALNLGFGTVTGALSASSNGGNITQTSAITVGGATFNAGTGDITMTASNVYNGSVTIYANNANFKMAAGTTGVDRLSVVQVNGIFNLAPSTDGTTVNLANGAGGFQLTTTQLNQFSVGTLAPTTSLAGSINIGTFNFSGVKNLSLTTTGTGNIAATGAITLQTLSMNSGGSATFAVPNHIQNLGTTVVRSGGLTFQNQNGLNLTGSASMPGRLSLEVAGQFYNQTGAESPLAGVQLGSVIKSLSLMGGLPNSVSGLAGFSYRYDGAIPTSGNVMSYAVSPLALFAPSGTVIAGVDLSGTQTGGGQFNTFLTGSDDLNWIISDFGKFNLPKVSSAGLEYTIYPKRVEPETRTLPDSTLSQLRQELGRPPTIEEINRREVSMRQSDRLRSGSILERSSLDSAEEGNEPQENAKTTTPSPIGGQVPQANQGPEKVVPTENSSFELAPPVASFQLLPADSFQSKADERAAVSELLVKERASAEVGLSIPVAHSK